MPTAWKVEPHAESTGRHSHACWRNLRWNCYQFADKFCCCNHPGAGDLLNPWEILEWVLLSDWKSVVIFRSTAWVVDFISTWFPYFWRLGLAQTMEVLCNIPTYCLICITDHLYVHLISLVKYCAINVNSCRRGLALLRAIYDYGWISCISLMDIVFPRLLELHISEEKREKNKEQYLFCL